MRKHVSKPTIIEGRDFSSLTNKKFGHTKHFWKNIKLISNTLTQDTFIPTTIETKLNSKFIHNMSANIVGWTETKYRVDNPWVLLRFLADMRTLVILINKMQ